MENTLSNDEFDALAEIAGAKPRERPSARVARNAKRLTGLKYATYGKGNQLALTEKGQQVLFIKRCIDGLRAVANDPLARLDPGVATFLGKKGHIAARSDADGFEITQRGRESLADIDAQAAQRHSG